MSGGVLRFFGRDAMRVVRELVDGDDEYSWGYPAWPSEWIDVACYSVRARLVLLEAVGGAYEHRPST